MEPTVVLWWEQQGGESSVVFWSRRRKGWEWERESAESIGSRIRILPFNERKKVKGNSYYGRRICLQLESDVLKDSSCAVSGWQIRCAAPSETVEQFETDVNFCSHLVQAHCKPSERGIQRRGWATGLQRKTRRGDKWQSCKSLHKRIVVAHGWKRQHKNRPDTKQSFMNRKEDKRKESAWHRRQNDKNWGRKRSQGSVWLTMTALGSVPMGTVAESHC